MNGTVPSGSRPGVAARWLLAIPKLIIGALILASIVLNFANVIARYLFLAPIPWAEEIMIFIMIWCVFVGVILVAWDGTHLRMDLLSSILPSPWKEIVNFVTWAAAVGICGFVAVQSWDATALFDRMGAKSVIAGIPMVVPHAAITLGFVALTVVFVVRVRQYLTGRFDAQAGARGEMDLSAE
jgi:TRAP-type C4-dicarboxylate transport system permease small subunit